MGGSRMSLLPIEEFCEFYGKSENSLYQNANLIGYDKCKWYVKYDGLIYIDIDEYNKPADLFRAVWSRNTDYLYWLMIDLYGNNLAMSKALAEYSEVFTSANSWNTWLGTSCFENPNKNVISSTYTQTHEFYRISIRRLAVAIKQGIKLGKDFE